MTLASEPPSSVMLKHADGANLDAHAGEQRVVEQHEHVDGVAVEAERVLEEAVVGRVDECRVEHAVEVDATGLVVDLVLVAASAGDLDDCVYSAMAGSPLIQGLGSTFRGSTLMVQRA